MLSINTEISEALARLHIKCSPVSSHTVFTAQFKCSIMMLKDLLSILELYITINIIYTHPVHHLSVSLRVSVQQKSRFCTNV